VFRVYGLGFYRGKKLSALVLHHQTPKKNTRTSRYKTHDAQNEINKDIKRNLEAGSIVRALFFFVFFFFLCVFIGSGGDCCGFLS